MTLLASDRLKKEPLNAGTTVTIDLSNTSTTKRRSKKKVETTPSADLTPKVPSQSDTFKATLATALQNFQIKMIGDRNVSIRKVSFTAEEIAENLKYLGDNQLLTAEQIKALDNTENYQHVYANLVALHKAGKIANGSTLQLQTHALTLVFGHDAGLEFFVSNPDKVMKEIQTNWKEVDIFLTSLLHYPTVVEDVIDIFNRGLLSLYSLNQLPDEQMEKFAYNLLAFHDEFGSNKNFAGFLSSLDEFETYALQELFATSSGYNTVVSIKDFPEVITALVMFATTKGALLEFGGQKGADLFKKLMIALKATPYFAKVFALKEFNFDTLYNLLMNDFGKEALGRLFNYAQENKDNLAWFERLKSLGDGHLTQIFRNDARAKAFSENFEQFKELLSRAQQGAEKFDQLLDAFEKFPGLSGPMKEGVMAIDDALDIFTSKDRDQFFGNLLDAINNQPRLKEFLKSDKITLAQLVELIQDEDYTGVMKGLYDIVDHRVNLTSKIKGVSETVLLAILKDKTLVDFIVNSVDADTVEGLFNAAANGVMSLVDFFKNNKTADQRATGFKKWLCCVKA